MYFRLRHLLLFSLFLCLTPLALSAQLASDNGDEVLQKEDWLADGVELGKKKKFQQAASKFERALDSWQTYHHARLYLQIIEDQSNELIKNKYAAEIFKSVHENFQGKQKSALKKINKVIKKNKAYFPAYLVKGEILNSYERTEEAEAIYSNAIELAKEASLPLVFRGKFFEKNLEYTRAAADFSRAITLAPSETAIFFTRGFVFCLQRKYDQAIADFEAAAKKYPQWQNSTIVFEAYYNRAIQRMQKKSYRKAIADFTHAIRIDPAYLQAHLNRGIAYKNIKQYSKAKQDFQYCTDKNPNLADAYYQRATMNYTRGKYRSASNDLAQVLKIEPNNSKALVKLGQTQSKLGRYKDALKQYDKVLALNSNYVLAHYEKGLALKGLRKSSQAIQSFQRFIQLAPERYYKQIALAKVEIQKLKRASK
ncbi:MAG: tetratricopeptide repeat protein [bacterium]